MVGGQDASRKQSFTGWWTHNAIHKWCIIELYAWNLYNFINQSYPNKFNLKNVNEIEGKKEIKSRILILKVSDYSHIGNISALRVFKHISLNQ